MGCGVSSTVAHSHKPVSIDHFYICEVLGKGAFGKVCVIKRKTDNHLFALKYTQKKKAFDEKAIQHVVQERNILEEIRHALICGLRYSFQDEEFMYMVLDFISGGDLRYHIKSRLWNQNILLDSAGHAHLSDFNIAIRQIDGKSLRYVAGTEPCKFNYMAPEMISGMGYHSSVDWWSLGVIMFEMVCGERPFRSKIRRELIRRAKFKFPILPPGSGIVTDLVKSVITGFLQLNPRERLGYETKGFSLLQNHLLFNGINWLMIDNKTAKPVFVPDMSLINFKTDADVNDLVKFVNRKRICSDRYKTPLVFQSFTDFDYTLMESTSKHTSTRMTALASKAIELEGYNHVDRINTTFETNNSSEISKLISQATHRSMHKSNSKIINSSCTGKAAHRHSTISCYTIDDMSRLSVVASIESSQGYHSPFGHAGPSYGGLLSPFAYKNNTNSPVAAPSTQSHIVNSHSANANNTTHDHILPPPHHRQFTYSSTHYQDR
ncbi:hypothetical protein BDEG_26387 [Batrachochytrium dendrobatidis JEL423]|uniref:Protein kinase domain-containing protein n=1 Tax=Batrachochytrium dendrobatidis (strain JEL423) TaxID=403673 RepID=A0A177WSX3_BATDL|nr:hypothetical protein BDEG_26387 [Batrachochytrium dendrobatidis JEL423]